MKKFTNQNVLKEIKNINKIIIIGIIILVFGIALGLWGGYEIDKTSENAKSFSELLLSDEEKENQIAKLDVTHVPYQFAVQDGNDNSYYIVMDEDYMYVAYMPTSTFNSLNREDISENPEKIEGMTKLATREIKELAVEAYNDAIEDENYKITVADYDNYFGSVYLDASEDALLDVGSLQMTGCMICLIIGLASLLIGIIKKVHFNISVKKMDEDLIIPDKNKTLYDGVKAFGSSTMKKGDTMAKMYFESIGKHYGVEIKNKKIKRGENYEIWGSNQNCREGI